MKLKFSGGRGRHAIIIQNASKAKNMIEAEISIAVLIKKARVQGLSDNKYIDFQMRTAIRKADKEKRHLTDVEIRNICEFSGTSPIEISMIRDRSNDLVTAARKKLLTEQPELVIPGGALYPSQRADACWRDCWEFLRVINYAYACDKTEFTSPEGMAALRELYKKMDVPLNGLSTALRQLEILTKEEVESEKGKSQLSNIFRHLLEELNISAVKT